MRDKVKYCQATNSRMHIYRHNKSGQHGKAELQSGTNLHLKCYLLGGGYGGGISA